MIGIIGAMEKEINLLRLLWVLVPHLLQLHLV